MNKKIDGIYLNGFLDVEEVKNVKWTKEEAHRKIAKKGGVFVFQENGEKKVIISDDERGKRSVILGRLFGYF